MSYFKRIDGLTFEATDHVGGAWDPETQHIAPALGLLAHAVEVDRDQRRTDRPVLGRLSYDILGTVPVDRIGIRVDVLRPGRTIELVEAVLSHNGRDAASRFPQRRPDRPPLRRASRGVDRLRHHRLLRGGWCGRDHQRHPRPPRTLRDGLADPHNQARALMTCLRRAHSKVSTTLSGCLSWPDEH